MSDELLIQVPFFDGKRIYASRRDEIDKAISEALADGTYINGVAVKEFSIHLASYLGIENVIPCGNGTDALTLALMALNLKVGDEIIVPTFNFVAAAEAIVLLGLIPMFVDASFDDFNLDPEKIEALITDKTKAIIIVHLFGASAQVDKITEIAKKYQLYIIEDVAQSLGGKFDGSFLGTFGHIGCTSFFPTKNLACFGDGGALFTNNPDLAKKIRILANHGQEKKYKHIEIGMNSRLDTLQASILDVQLRYLDFDIEKRRTIANIYYQELKSISSINLPFEKEKMFHSFNQYCIALPNRDVRDGLMFYLNQYCVGTMIYYPLAMHQQKAFMTYSCREENLLVSENLCSRVLALPVFPGLTTQEQSYIIKIIKNFFGNVN